MSKFQGFSARFVIIALLALALTVPTAWIMGINGRQLMGLVLIAWIVGIYVAVFDRFRR
jgi:hypothetical protein